MRPKVSVVMAAYNAAEHIKEAIDSVLGQSFPYFEVLVAVDKSDDGTLAVVRSIKDRRVKVLYSKRVTNPAMARNRCLRRAKGKYMAILDADDVMTEHSLLWRFLYLWRYDDVFLCGGDSLVVDRDGRPVGFRRSIKDVEKVLPYFDPFCHSTVMYRNVGYIYRSKFKYCEDYDFFLRLLTDGRKLVNIPHRIAITRKRIRPGWYNSPLFYEFGLKAKEFYRERIATGADSYASFDPSTIRPKDASYTSAGALKWLKDLVNSDYHLRTLWFELESMFPQLSVHAVKFVEHKHKKEAK